MRKKPHTNMWKRPKGRATVVGWAPIQNVHAQFSQGFKDLAFLLLLVHNRCKTLKVSKANKTTTKRCKAIKAGKARKVTTKLCSKNDSRFRRAFGAMPITTFGAIPIACLHKIMEYLGWIYEHNNYILRKKDILGSGGEATVYKAKSCKSGQIVAAKCFDKTTERLRDRPERCKVELHVLLVIPKHPNIVNLLDYSDKPHLFIMYTTFYSRGNLADFLTHHPFVMTNIRTSRVISQLAQAIHFVHKHGFCHRDIKLENIFMDNHFNIKLGDFGYARKQRKEERLAKVCGTPQYVSPEILYQHAYCGFKADTWSFGVCIYVITHRFFPFNGKNKWQLFESIKHDKPKVLLRLKHQYHILIQKTLEKDPEERWNINACVKFLHKNNKQSM